MWLPALIMLSGLSPAARAQRVRWSQVRCSTDVRAMSEGRVQDSGRFPWLGLLQHSFNFKNFSRFAVSPAILIHPAYALAGARDVQAIPEDRLREFTQFISLRGGGGRSALPAVRAVLHPEFPLRSLASLALVELDPRAVSYSGVRNPGPVLPVCMPFSGLGVLNDEFYAVHMTDDGGELNKKIFKMSYLDDNACDEFYARTGLNYSGMSPVHSLCVAAVLQPAPCVWDEGSALVTRQQWEQFKLMGFGVRGPGCGAPARFLAVHPYLSWIEAEIAGAGRPRSGRRSGGPALRQLGIEQKADAMLLFTESEDRKHHRIGSCASSTRGKPIYQEEMFISSGKRELTYGFFFLEVLGELAVTCVLLRVETSGHTKPTIWMENDCYHDNGLGRLGQPEWKRCFKYFRSTAHLEFRFKFVGSARVMLQVYTMEAPRSVDASDITETTKKWDPTTTTYFIPLLFRNYLESDTPTEW